MGREGGLAAAKKYAGTPEQRAWSSRGGKNQPFEVKSAAGKKRFRLHGNPATYESRLKGNQALTTEQRQRGGVNQPREAKVLGGEAATHLRWHVNRGPKNPKKCRLCAEEIMRRRQIITLEHRIGTLRVVVAGTTESGKQFIRVELPQAGYKGRKVFKAILAEDVDWSDPKEVLKAWEMFNTETPCEPIKITGQD